jgi:hypothetical protein
MTWIVGAPVMFGYGFAVSDVRVTLASGEERDCLQKVYPVGKFIAAGFAGSVRIGFAMLETLSSLLNVPEAEGDDKAWDPVAISRWWPADARDVFSKFPATEQACHSHLMLIGTSPTETNGDAPWAKAYVYIFRSPEFTPEEVSPGQIGAIGSGNFVEPCRDMVQRFSSDHSARFQLMQGEVGQPGGMGQMFGWRATTILKDCRPNGISSHLHYCWVYRGRIVIQTNDHTTYGAWTSFPIGLDTPEAPEKSSGTNPVTGEPEEVGVQHFTMPVIAQSWNELQKLLSAEGATAEGAVAQLLRNFRGIIHNTLGFR